MGTGPSRRAAAGRGWPQRGVDREHRRRQRWRRRLRHRRGSKRLEAVTLWCAASTSGLVRREAFEAIAGELVEGLDGRSPRRHLSRLHGAMVRSTRTMPKASSLSGSAALSGTRCRSSPASNSHANVTTAIWSRPQTSWSRSAPYPHVDMAGRGGGRIRPRGHRVRAASRQGVPAIPFLIPNCGRGRPPNRAGAIYAELPPGDRWRRQSQLRASLSRRRFPDCRPSVLAYAAEAEQAGAPQRIASQDLDRAREPCLTDRLEPDEAVRIAKAAGAPGTAVVSRRPRTIPGAAAIPDTTGMCSAPRARRGSRAAIGLLVDAGGRGGRAAAGAGATLRLIRGRSGVAATRR